MSRSIVALMAHADDIEYYAGATFARYARQGYRMLYGVLSRCNSGWSVTQERGGFYTSSERIVPRRREEAAAAATVYGAQLYQGDLLENCWTRRDGVRVVPSFTGALTIGGAPVGVDEDLPAGVPLAVAAGAGASWEENTYARELADLLVEWEPELVIGQEHTNFNPDHFAAAQLVAVAWLQASRRARIGPYQVPITFPVPGTHAFPPMEPTLILDVTGDTDTCLRAIACHRSQGGHLETTAAYLRTSWSGWGARIGVGAAEAFRTVYEPAAAVVD